MLDHFKRIALSTTCLNSVVKPATGSRRPFGHFNAEARAGRPGHRGAYLTFLGTLFLSVLPLLYWGQRSWFGIDDWDFFTSRHADDVGDLFRSHYGHWTTIPILIYRALFNLVGLHHYWPYQLVLICLHLTIAVLLRLIFCRAGVRPWLATLGAILLVFFGSGSENIIVAFQITFLGALMLGLLQIILVDHEGPIDHRDALGLLAGFGALNFSGVAIPIIAAVGLVALRRRGWQLAAIQTMPLALIYLAWLYWSPPSENIFLVSAPTIQSLTAFVWIGFKSSFIALGFMPAAGLLVFFLTIVGFIESWRSKRQDLVLPVALAIAAVILMFLIAWGRSGELMFFPDVLGPKHAATSRYIYLIVALLLPLIMVAFEALIVRWSWSQALLYALIVSTLITNIQMFEVHTMADKRRAKGLLITAVPTLPGADQLPRSAIPSRFIASKATVGWLLDNADKIPVTTLSPESTAELLTRLNGQAKQD